MMNLMKGVFGPSIPYQDKIMYMTALGLNHSIGSDKNAKNPVCVEQILALVTSSNTRYLGLQLLELALNQNFDNIYNKGRWVLITYNLIKDSRAANLEKIQSCKILSMMIPYMADDPTLGEAKEEFVKDIFPVLLTKIHQQVEWTEEASTCLKMSLKTFPKDLSCYQINLLDTILSQASSNVSSKSFEVLAECFCELPYCTRDNNVENIQDRWEELYLRTLKTIESIQVACLSRMSGNDPYSPVEIEHLTEFNFKEESDDGNFFPAFVKRVRRFVNLCKCLAKLLSVKPKYPMKVPVTLTVKCLLPLYTSCRKEKLISPEEEILCTFIAQMRLAGLVVLESLILNFNLLKDTVLMRDIIRMSIVSSSTIFSSEYVSELRVATWNLFSLWLDGFGRKVAKEIALTSELTEEILNDINIDVTEAPKTSDAAHGKSKKSTGLDSSRKSMLKRKNQQRVCEAALNSLESLLYTGSLDIPKGVFQEICKRVFKICDTIHSSSDPYPFPYNDESCREKLYSVVLTIAVVLKSDEFQILQTAMKILAHINNDSSFKVRKLSNKVPVMYRLQFYPKRPLPPCSDNKQRRPNVSNEVLKHTAWSTPEYVPNIKIETVSETPENVNLNVEQSFQNENDIEVHSEEFMEVEPQYHEQVIENQCNGEDILEIRTSSQCQDDIESDEEEEEEEEERSYGDEEINQEEHLQEMYIPASRKSPLPVQINAETVQSITEPEYEELTPCIKSEENVLNISNKDKCVNGEDNVMHDDEVPSSSTQITNENGIFGMDDDDLDEENEDEEDEENELVLAEKRAENCDPPPKRQKVEATDDDDEVDERKEKERSPTLEEMKADFLELIPSSIEDVNSGKVPMSTS